MEFQGQFPVLIEIVPFEQGFVLRVNKSSTFYNNLENLARAIYPSVRHELNNERTCAGSC